MPPLASPEKDKWTASYLTEVVEPEPLLNFATKALPQVEGDQDEDMEALGCKLRKETSTLSLSEMLSDVNEAIPLENSRRLRRCMVDPSTNKLLWYWDVASAMLLCYVALVTPFEAGFMEYQMFTLLWWFNHVVNMFFLGELFLQFFLPVSINSGHGVDGTRRKRLSYDRRVIAQVYLKSWFPVDFLSVFPFDLFVPGGGLGLLKTVRVLRLLKLVRVFKGARLVQRWQAELNYSQRRVTLYALIALVMFVAHWMACLLGLIARLQGGIPCNTEESCAEAGSHVTWLSLAREWYDDFYDGDSGFHLGDAYLVALHTSLSIVVHPHSNKPTNLMERVVFCILMLLGGFLWTQIISRSTAICTSLDRHNIQHQQTMDDINEISAELNLSHDCRKRLRKFFLKAKGASKIAVWKRLTDRMSPQLQRDTAREVNNFWIKQVQFLKKCWYSVAFMTDLCSALEVHMYTEQEHFGSQGHMYILMEGLVSLLQHGASFSRFQVAAAGSVWGEDHLLLENGGLLKSNRSVTLTFVNARTLSKTDFDAILGNFPQVKKIVREQVVKYAFIRGVKNYAKNLQIAQAEATHQSPLPPDCMHDLKEHEKDGLQRRDIDSITPARRRKNSMQLGRPEDWPTCNGIQELVEQQRELVQNQQAMAEQTRTLLERHNEILLQHQELQASMAKLQACREEKKVTQILM